MKKKISLLLAIIILLSGCNTAEKVERTTAETTAITTTMTAEATVVTTESVVETTAVDNPAIVSAVAPKLTDKKITVLKMQPKRQR